MYMQIIIQRKAFVLVYKTNIIGPNTEHWGIPKSSSTFPDSTLLTTVVLFEFQPVTMTLSILKTRLDYPILNSNPKVYQRGFDRDIMMTALTVIWWSKIVDRHPSSQTISASLRFCNLYCFKFVIQCSDCFCNIVNHGDCCVPPLYSYRH